MYAPSFKLEMFEGPLDLLLYLIQKNKLNIEDIPIAEITNQYMEVIQNFDLEITSEFLVMASHLLYMKSKTLIPAEQEEVEELKEDLQARLIEYKKVKQAAQKLSEVQFSTIDNYFKMPEKMGKTIIENIPMQAESLLNAFELLLQRKEAFMPPPKSAFSGIVGRERTPIEYSIKYIHALFKIKPSMLFEDIFEGLDDRYEIVSAFVALLHVVSQGHLKIKEEGLKIYLIKNGEEQ